MCAAGFDKLAAANRRIERLSVFEHVCTDASMSLSLQEGVIRVSMKTRAAVMSIALLNTNSWVDLQRKALIFLKTFP